MKGLLSKVVVVVAGAAALFGISANNVIAMTSAPDISSKSALYLEHGKSIGNSPLNGFNDHYSHSSHESHSSHYSHYSGR
jgi:hypothetical protein